MAEKVNGLIGKPVPDFLSLAGITYARAICETEWHEDLTKYT
jgi:hypothetical protein